MQNKNTYVVVLISVLLLTFLNVGMNIYNLIDYAARKESGNQMWNLVEQRIVQLETQVNELSK